MSKRAIAVIGDVNYVEHGGMVVFDNGDLELVQPGENEEDPVVIYRFAADQVAEPSREWFGDDLKNVAKYVDVALVDLAAALNSEDVRVRASAYYDLVGYFGGQNFDESPLTLTTKEAERRYRSVDRSLAKRKR
jgi:hypothetical protein